MLHKIQNALKDKWQDLSPSKQQRLLVGTFGGGGCLLVGVLFLSLTSPSRAKEDKTFQTPKDINLQTAKESTDPNLSWRQQMEVEQHVLDRKLEEIKSLIQGQQKTTSSSVDLDELKSEVKALENELHEQVLSKESKPSLNEDGSSLEGEKGADTQIQEPPQASLSNPPLQQLTSFPPTPPVREQEIPQGVVKFVVTKKEGAKKIKATVENTVPSGTFARAVIMGGVDASTSVQASSDPRPVLLRVVDKGTLPRQFKSDLKQCHILASSYGDLSSERVLMRLEKLSCVEELTGEISETQVSGYIAGEDGRAGVRGVLVDKAGAQLRNAFVGGFFGGMGEFLTQSMRGQSMSMTPLGQVTQFNPLSKGDILKSGAGKGLTSAFEKFSDFYIKRAEQLQPVLQVAAGRIVDIVFTDRASFEATDVRQTLTNLREVSRSETVKNLESQGDDMKKWLPSQSLTPPQSS